MSSRLLLSFWEAMYAGPAQSAALEINKDVASKAWPSVLDPIVDSRVADNELRTLSAAAR